MTAREFGELQARMGAVEKLLDAMADDIRFLRENHAANQGSRRTLVAITGGIASFVGAGVTLLADRLGLPRV